MVDAAVLVPRPTKEHLLSDLAMRGSESEIPEPFSCSWP